MGSISLQPHTTVEHSHCPKGNLLFSWKSYRTEYRELIPNLTHYTDMMRYEKCFES